MNDNKKRLPFKISEYITEHFKEDFLVEVKKVRKLKEHYYYTIEVIKDNFIHTLLLNEDGVLIKDETEQTFPSEIQEEPAPEDVPE